MFPLSTVVFPDAELPLHVFEPRYRQLVADVLETTREFGTVLITAGSEVGGGDRRAEIGTLVRVEMAMPLEDGRWLLATLLVALVAWRSLRRFVALLGDGKDPA